MPALRDTNHQSVHALEVETVASLMVSERTGNKPKLCGGKRVLISLVGSRLRATAADNKQVFVRASDAAARWGRWPALGEYLVLRPVAGGSPPSRCPTFQGEAMWLQTPWARLSENWVGATRISG